MGWTVNLNDDSRKATFPKGRTKEQDRVDWTASTEWYTRSIVRPGPYASFSRGPATRVIPGLICDSTTDGTTMGCPNQLGSLSFPVRWRNTQRGIPIASIRRSSPTHAKHAF